MSSFIQLPLPLLDVLPFDHVTPLLDVGGYNTAGGTTMAAKLKHCRYCGVKHSRRSEYCSTEHRNSLARAMAAFKSGRSHAVVTYSTTDGDPSTLLRHNGSEALVPNSALSSEVSS